VYPHKKSLPFTFGSFGTLAPPRFFTRDFRCMERYEGRTKVGEGTYGIVYKAKDRISGEFVALKTM
jgi:hypothetical protein